MWKPDILKKIEEEYGFKVFSDGAYDLNIIGVRNLENNANQYDDKLHVCYLSEDGYWKEDIFQVSTDPGRYWLEKEDYKACAVYKHPQQARGAYKVGMHRGKYEALVQCQPVEYWRDGNKDFKADYGGEVFKNIIGLNIHRSSIHDSDEVNKYSAGCIVFSKMSDWESFMELVHKQKKTMGYHTFTFTLIAE
jgi:hypothetical protein